MQWQRMGGEGERINDRKGRGEKDKGLPRRMGEARGVTVRIVSLGREREKK